MARTQSEAQGVGGNLQKKHLQKQSWWTKIF